MNEPLIVTDTLKSVLAAGGLEMKETDVAPYAATQEERTLVVPKSPRPGHSRVTLPLLNRYLNALKEAGLITPADRYRLMVAAAKQERQVLRWLLKTYGKVLTPAEKEKLVSFATTEPTFGVGAMIGLYVGLTHEQRRTLLEVTLGNLAEHVNGVAFFAHYAKNLPLLEAWRAHFPREVTGSETLDWGVIPIFEQIMNDIFTYVSVYAKIYGETELREIYDGSPMVNLLKWDDFWALVLKYRELAHSAIKAP